MRFLEVVLVISIGLSCLSSGALSLSFIAWICALLFAPLQASLMLTIVIISFMTLVIFIAIAGVITLVEIGQEGF